MKIRLISLPLLILIYLLSGCSTVKTNDYTTAQIVKYPECRLLIFSDPHFLSPSLYDGGKAFRSSLLYKKGNLTEYGPEILESLHNRIDQENPDFIIITGDLTNNGERQSHGEFISYLKTLESEGQIIFLIPGNHDMENPYAQGFSGSRTYPAPTITRGEFLNLYGEFGYEEARSRDSWSLSYAVEPQPGLLLIGLDTNIPGYGYGFLQDQTLRWLEGELQLARSRGESVMVFMHHPLLEHFPGQDRDREMSLRNRKDLLNLLLAYSVEIVFTGHYHAQDIVSYQRGGRTIYDIETGSLISWPFSYRMVESRPQEIRISGGSLEIPELEGRGWELTYGRIYGFSQMFLSRYGVRAGDRELISDYVSRVLLNHYGGNEGDREEIPFPSGLSLKGRLAMAVGKGYYEGRLGDPEPDDLILVIGNNEAASTAIP